jgi:hypothetical protein
MAWPGEICKIWFRAAVEGNLSETERCRPAVNPPIQRAASHLIQPSFRWSRFAIEYRVISRVLPILNEQHLQRFRLSSRWGLIRLNS